LIEIILLLKFILVRLAIGEKNLRKVARYSSDEFAK